MYAYLVLKACAYTSKKQSGYTCMYTSFLKRVHGFFFLKKHSGYTCMYTSFLKRVHGKVHLKEAVTPYICM